MPVNSNSTEQKTDFAEKMAKMSNDQLTEVLKKRNLYQKAAADQAIYEAIERGIIHSEEDLLGPEFREKKLRRQLFPEIENEKIRHKIRKSIARGLLLAGSLPAILGVMRITRGSLTEGIILLGFTAIWMTAAVGMFRSFSRTALTVLITLAVLSVVYALKLFFTPPGNSIMDKFIVIMLYLLISYGLMYLKRLNR